MIINYFKQPSGNTCGPTCIKMAHSSIKQGSLMDSEAFPIEAIAEMCGTDWIVGTPPDRMEKGFKALEMDYKIHLNDEKPYEKLKSLIDNEKITILRTLTHGVPHWIVIESYVGDTYNVLDPWLGRIQYTEKQLEDIWSVRDYFIFEI